MYTVYKITNTINQKYYIGVHKTNNLNDKYLRSGLAIKNAIKKYGHSNFKKEIIFTSESKSEAYALEKSLTENFNTSKSYNMKCGGVGGFTREQSLKGYNKVKDKFASIGGKSAVKAGFGFGGVHRDASVNGHKGGLANKGKPKSEKHKENIRESWRRKKIMQETQNGVAGGS